MNNTKFYKHLVYLRKIEMDFYRNDFEIQKYSLNNYKKYYKNFNKLSVKTYDKYKKGFPNPRFRIQLKKFYYKCKVNNKHQVLSFTNKQYYEFFIIDLIKLSKNQLIFFLNKI